MRNCCIPREIVRGNECREIWWAQQAAGKAIRDICTLKARTGEIQCKVLAVLNSCDERDGAWLSGDGPFFRKLRIEKSLRVFGRGIWNRVRDVIEQRRLAHGLHAESARL